MRLGSGEQEEMAMALDAATTEFLGQLEQTGAPPIQQMTPEQARGIGPMLRDLCGPGPALAAVTEHRVPLRDGEEIDVRVLSPTGSPRGLMVYFHGGGWVIGHIDEFDAVGRALAERTGCAVAMVNYRKAPEHRYPTAAEDAWAATRWAAERVGELAGPGAPLIVAGDSAGGNLAAVVAQQARDAGGPDIALQVLVYPVTDCDLDRPSYVAEENQLLIDRASMVWFWDHYAPDPASRQSPDASPLRAASLAGLPPAVVVLAEHDVLRDEGEAYAARLRADGVAVDERVFDGQTHVFFHLINVLPAAQAAVDHIAERAAARLGW